MSKESRESLGDVRDRPGPSSARNGSVRAQLPPGRKARFDRGRALRKACPRSSHADIVLGQGPRDPLSLIELSNTDRLPGLLPLRYGRMADSALAFFRGTAYLQAHDLCGTPSSGIIVQNCGDCHLMNFGGFASPERTLVFDITDFDETFPAPFEWDLKRLAASFVVAARWLKFQPKDCREAAVKVAASYREHVGRLAGMQALEVWNARITVESLLEEFAIDPEILRRLTRDVERAKLNTSAHVFHKITHEENGHARINDQPPLLFHVDSSVLDVERVVTPFLERYRASLREDYRALYDRFHFADIAFKVVGVGSVGTYSFVALFLSDADDPLFLQIKQARKSVLEGFASSTPRENHGERIVAGQRLMQSASDIFLGWSSGEGDHDFYVRQLRDMKFATTLNGFTPRLLTHYAKMCGHVLARAHSKAGDAATIAGYVGCGTAFDAAIARYAIAYADQVDRDFEAFRDGIQSARFLTDAMPPGIEQALR